MANKTSQHILGTSSTLLGFCLVVLSSLHISDKASKSLVDEFTTVIALLFACSSVFSFISIKITDSGKETKYEKIADYLFLASLIGILGIIVFIIFEFWK